MNDKVHNLDLRGVACPMNFVKTRLYLDKMAAGEVVKVWLDPGEPVESVSTSVQEEGHELLSLVEDPGGHFEISIRRV